MEIDNAKPGNFCWFELATSDQAAAKKFYGALFGWTPSDEPMGPHGFYTTFQLRGRKLGAAYTLMRDQSQEWLQPIWGSYLVCRCCAENIVNARTMGSTTLVGSWNLA